MSVPSAADTTPIESRDQLVAYLASGEKPRAQWRLGTEHEKFAFDLETLRPLPYEGPKGIKALLEGFFRFGWEPVREGETLIGAVKDKAAISLEPGGQLELSGAPLETVHQTCDEVHTHLAEAKTICSEIGAGLLGLGFNPKWRREDIPWMPKGRYKIMREYMPKKGMLGLDMMLRTCTVQVNLDFSSEADMVKKLRVALALQPVATALFANSPFTEGKPNGFLSYRAHIWTDTDPDRTGMLPFAFEDGMGFERYVDYALDVPMYFVYRNGRYNDVSGQSFRAFIDGKLPGLPGERPTLSDWADHLTTLFPEARLKKYLEMRGADGGRWRSLCALPALWAGLLYDQGALDAAWDLVKDWTAAERTALRDAVPRQGFKAKFRRETVADIARRMVALSREGLKRRAQNDRIGQDETAFLNDIQEAAESGRTFAETLLDAYNTRWGGNIDPVFVERAF
ncbi:MAG: glutamate--cysteine ligase [Rhodospirillaceae bacterium]|nr:glutamate--cysteine ligase [Rhodospirillaceae bacterium]